MDVQDPVLTPLNGIQGKNEFAFYTIRVDGLDFYKKNMRVVNYLGEPSNEGRLEVRVEGVWGTISYNPKNEKFVKLVCKHLGFTCNFILIKQLLSTISILIEIN